MRNRVISALIAAVMSVVMLSPVAAKEPEVKTYYSLETDICLWSGYKYSETFDYMLVEKDDETRVYIKAEDVMYLCGYNVEYGADEDPYRIYQYGQCATECAIVNPYAELVIRYGFDSERVCVVFGDYETTYTAPFKAVCKNGVAWVPFDFTMRLLGCDVVVGDNDLTVYAPAVNQFAVIKYLRDTSELSFDWTTEGDLSWWELQLVQTRNKTMNLLSGVLSFELPYIATALLSMPSTDPTMNMLKTLGLIDGDEFYNNELSEMIAQLYLVPTESEIKVDGEVSMLTFPLSDVLNAGVDTLGWVDTVGNIGRDEIENKTMAEILERLMEQYPKLKSSDAVETVHDYIKNNNKAAKMANELGEKLSKKLKTVEGTDLNILDFLSAAIKIVDYHRMLSQKTDMAVKTLELYSKCTEYDEMGALWKNAVVAKKADAVDSLQLYVLNNWDEFLMGMLPIEAFLSAPILVGKLCWDVASSTVLSEVLDATEAFEISVYASYYQNEAYGFVADADDIDELVSFSYAYLKFSYIARNRAIAAIDVSSLDFSAKSEIAEEMRDKNGHLAKLINTLEYDMFMPSDCSAAKWDEKTIAEVLKNNGDKLENVTQLTRIYPEVTDFPNIGGGDIISEEDAEDLVHHVMSDFSWGMMDGLFNGYYEFETETIFQTEDGMAYVVKMLIDETSDETRFFVPLDGSAVWLGMIQPDDTYFCYSDLNLLHASYGDMMEAVFDLSSDLLG